MAGSIKDKIAIIGMGCTKFGERWDVGTEDLAIEAVYEAYEDAGIGPDDIQACWMGTVSAPLIGIGGTIAANALKLNNIPIIRNENWCASGHIALLEACMAVASGVFDTVLALGVEKLKDTGFAGLGTGLPEESRYLTSTSAVVRPFIMELGPLSVGSLRMATRLMAE